MRAIHTPGVGIDISLVLEDKEEVIKSGKINGMIMSEGRKLKLTLYVREVVPTNYGALERTGFHIAAWPPNAMPQKRTKYLVYLDTENFKKLTTNPPSKGNAFVSRCKYDRTHIYYWENINNP